MEIHHKFDPSRPAFQGHSRSLEPTWIDWQPMTSIVTIGLSRTVSYYKWLFLSKIANFSRSLCIERPCWGRFLGIS